MIKYLQKMKNKKGFTLIELIVVIAIIAVLAAMIMPMFSSDDAKRQAVNTYAASFYSGLQYNFTRYQKTEADLSPLIAKEQEYIKYDKDAGQNVLVNKFTYIEAYYDNGLKYIHVSDTLYNLLANTSTVSDTAFEKLLESNVGDIVSGAVSGYYYAVLYMNSYGNIKVITTHYTDERIPSSCTKDDLMFVDNSEISCGFYCGTCSSDQNKTGSYIGNIGTYFLNISAVSDNELDWA